MRYLFGLALMVGCSDKNVGTFNDNPEVSITSHQNGDVVNEGYVVEFRAALTDSNHDTNDLEAAWYVNGVETCPFLPPDGNGDSTCATTLSEPETGVRVEVRDPQNAVGEDIVSLTVVPTDTPTAEILNPGSDDVLYSDLLITFEGRVADTEDAPEDLIVSWASSIDGTLNIDSPVDQNGALTGFGNLTEGQHGLTLTVTDLTGKTGSDSVTVTVGPPNSAPGCAILTPQDDSVFLLGETITFTAESSDADIPSDQLSVSWTSDKDGTIGASTPNSDGSIAFPYAQLSANTHVMSMTVEDELEATCTDSVLITIGTPPTVSITSPTGGQTVNDGDLITFTATVADAEDAEVDLLIDWESSIDGIFSNTTADFNGLATFTDDARTVGSHTLTVTVTDSAGLQATALETFVVNGIPSEPAVIVTPDPALTTDALTATASGSIDADGDPVTYAYVWLQNGNPTGLTGTTLASSETLKGETWTVQGTPNDGFTDGPYGEADVTIVNSPPVISGLGITPATGITNTTTLTCSATVTDVDVVDTPGETFSWTINNTPAGTGDTLTLDSSIANPGDTVTCTLAVDDNDGGSTSDSVSVVVDNTAPLVSSVTVTPNTGVTPTDTVTCAVIGSDADNDPLTETFAWTNDSTGLPVGTGDTLALSPTLVSSGDILTCTATMTDPQNASDSGSDSITIVNPPVVTITAPTPNSVVNEGSPVNFEGLVSDAEDAATDLTLVWNSDVDGPLNSDGADTAGLASFSSSSLSMGTHSVTLIATDTDGLTAGDVVTFTINGLPTAPSVSIAPNPAVTSDSLTAVVSGATDPENHPLTYTYEWFLNGNPTSQTGISVADTDTSKGETWTVRATPNDGYGDGPFGEASVTVQNTPPTLTVSVNPNTGVLTGTGLTCVANASDADTDPLTTLYTWDVNGIPSGTANTFQLSTNNAAPADSVTCTVSVDDGTAVVIGSDTVVVENTLPVISSVIIDPDPAYTNEVLEAIVTESDSDGQTVTLTYDWMVNGQSVQNSGDSLLDGTLFSKGDAITVEVTPNDGIDAGLPVTGGPLTIQNSAPSQPVLLIVPSNPVEATDSLLCDVTTPSTDADLDGPTYTFSWTRNGNAYPGAVTTTYAGDTIPANATGANDLWECTVIPNDGTVDGPFATTSVTVAPLFDGTATSTSVDTLPEPTVDLLTMYDPAEERILVFGGATYYQLLDTLYSYDLGTQNWTAITPLGVPPLPVKGHAGVYDEGVNRWVFFGGESYYQLSSDTIALDATASAETWETWAPVAGAPEPRSGHAAAHDELGGFMYLFGGQGYYEMYNDLWLLDLTVTSAADWVELSPSGSIPEMTGASSAYEPTYDNLFVIGGQEYYQLSEDVYCFDANTLGWSTAILSGDPLPPMAGATATWSNYLGGILVYGGQGYYQLHESLYFLAPTSNCSLEVTEVALNGAPVPPMAGSDLVMDTINGTPYLIGGQGYYQLYDTVFGL